MFLFYPQCCWCFVFLSGIGWPSYECDRCLNLDIGNKYLGIKHVWSWPNTRHVCQRHIYIVQFYQADSEVLLNSAQFVLHCSILFTLWTDLNEHTCIILYWVHNAVLRLYEGRSFCSRKFFTCYIIEKFKTLMIIHPTTKIIQS